MAGTISSAGIGSGLDVQNIISKLMAVEQAPLVKLQRQAVGIQTQLSAFSQMQSLVSGFKDALAPLLKADTYSATIASSSDAAAVAVSSNGKAAAGSYAVSVSSLAAGQTLVSASGQFTQSTQTVGTGTITIRLGSWNADRSAFTPKTGSADLSIVIGGTDSSLEAVRDKINAANAGVHASIVTDASGARLSLQSSSTGADNGFRVTVDDDDGNDTDGAGLSRLAFDPASQPAQMSLTQAAANTAATVNGIAVTSSGTTLADVIEGVTLTVNKVTTSPVAINVSRSTDALKSALGAMVKAYNALNGYIDQMTDYDAEKKTAAPLQGDATAVGLQNQMRAQIGQNGGASSVFTSLSNLGIEFQKDGSLKLNDTKFAAAAANPAELKKALLGDGEGSTAVMGLAQKLNAWADRLLGTEGTFQGKTKSLKARQTSTEKDMERASDRLAQIEKRLTKQYTALDTTLSRSNALQQYVQQQITSWNNVKTST